MDWPHAPIHRLEPPGAYFITAGTYCKRHCFGTKERLDILEATLFALAESYRFPLQAWSIFSNHYHFIVSAESGGASLKDLISELHTASASEVNRLDRAPGRKVWFQFWDKHLTYERSYLARLNYVHRNPVHHGLVDEATNYRWCSASWFESQVSRAFAASVRRFGADHLNVMDNFTPSECAGLTAPWAGEGGVEPPQSEGGVEPPQSEGGVEPPQSEGGGKPPQS